MEDWSPANDALSSKDLELATTPWCQRDLKLKSENSKIKNENNSKQNCWEE